MNSLRPADEMWKEGRYYVEKPEALLREPLLPDVSRVRDRRIMDLFDRYAGLSEGARILEIGCGRSRWLPFLQRHRRARATGLDIEPYAAELARANLAGAGARGEVLCRDAFGIDNGDELLGQFDLVYSMGVMEHFADVVDRLAKLARYLRPAGRILTFVPNLHGLNYALQRLGCLETLEMHVIYDAGRLQAVHEEAGFQTLASGFVGFFDGYLSSSGKSRGVRRRVHNLLCRTASYGAEAFMRGTRCTVTPETRWLSPFVFYAGRRPARYAL